MYKGYLDLVNSPEYIQLYQYYMQDTFLDVLNVSRQENPHSSFIRWLMDPKRNGGLDEQPFRKLVQAAYYAADTLYKGAYPLIIDTALFKDGNINILDASAADTDIFRYGRYNIKEIVSRNEVVLIKQRRADIVIGAEISTPDEKIKYLVIVIENKIHSAENDSQTEDYAKALFERQNRDVFEAWFDLLFEDAELSEEDRIGILPIYLTPYRDYELIQDIEKKKRDGKPQKSLPKSDLFCAMNYQLLLDRVLEPCERLCNDDISLGRIRDYIRCLGQAKIARKNEQDKGDELVMAVSTQERDLALALWENHANALVRLFKDTDKYRDFVLYKSLVFIYLEKLREWKEDPAALAEFVNKYESDADDKAAELEQIFNTVRGNGKEYLYKGKRYKIGSRKNNLGMMCRDILADHIAEHGLQRADIEDLRSKLCAMGANWLQEVILFDHEVELLVNGIVPDSTVKYRYHTKGYEELAGSYFCGAGEAFRKNEKYDPYMDDPLAIKLKSNEKIFVGKYWGIAELEKLGKIIKGKKGHIDYTVV